MYVTNRLLTDHQQLVDSQQTDHLTESIRCQPTAGNLFVFSWPTVGRQSADSRQTGYRQLANSLLRGALLHNYPNYLPPISRWSFIYY